MLKHHDRWPSLDLPRKLQNENFGTDAESDLTAIDSQEIQSGADMSRIWLGAQYNSYRRLFPPSNGFLHALIWSAVWELRFLEVD
jgi:hypothetical protein